MTERRDLRSILKAVLDGRTDDVSKLELLTQLEVLELDVQGLNTALGVLRGLRKCDPIDDPLRLVRTQALQTETALLLSAHERFGDTEPAVPLIVSTHIEYLLSLCNGSDTNLKSVSAVCLTEMQLCFPGLIGSCESTIDALAAFESSPAHQPLLQLLSLLTTDEQTAAFLAAQLSLLSTPAMAFVTVQLSVTSSSNAAFLLKSLLLQLLASFSLTAVAVAARLAELLDEFRRQRLLNHVLSLAQDPGLPAASRLVLLDVAQYLAQRHGLGYTAPDLIPADGAHIKLKKLALALARPQIDVTNLETLIEEAATTKNKAVNAKAIFLASKFKETNELGQRIIVSAILKDLSFTPHLLQLIECVPDLEPPGLLGQVLMGPTPPGHHLPFVLLLLRQAVASKSAAVARPRESLRLVSQCVLDSHQLSPTLAHQLLSTCHQVVKVFDPADFASEMTALLGGVASKCPEEDVTARVASFEILLACLADAKVRELP